MATNCPQSKKKFDWLEAEQLDTSLFFKYRRNTYSLDEFMRLDDDSEWQGYLSENAFSEVVIQISKNAEYVKVGRMLS